MTDVAQLQAGVTAALARVHNPRLETDLLSGGMVRDVVVTAEGHVAFTFLLASEDPATLVREARAAVREVPGVNASEIKITVRNPAGAPSHSHAPPSAAGAQPVAGQHQGTQGPELPNLGRIIAISSGKGGVGKSTVAANLAIALARLGFSVGLMDADVYGPNIPRMFGVFEKPPVFGGRIQPLEAHGVKLMSLGFLVDRDAPAIWRGPIIMKVVQQFLRDVEWGQLDYFLVDLPPGTGDAQLSLVQQSHVHAALIVTTPQEVSVGDALRGAKMFERVGVPVIGVIENMSAFVDPDTGKRYEIFSSGGGQRLAEELRVPLLASVPLQPGIADAADAGEPVLVAAPDSPASRVLLELAAKVQAAVSMPTAPLPILRG